MNLSASYPGPKPISRTRLLAILENWTTSPSHGCSTLSRKARALLKNSSVPGANPGAEVQPVGEAPQVFFASSFASCNGASWRFAEGKLSLEQRPQPLKLTKSWRILKVDVQLHN